MSFKVGVGSDARPMTAAELAKHQAAIAGEKRRLGLDQGNDDAAGSASGARPQQHRRPTARRPAATPQTAPALDNDRRYKLVQTQITTAAAALQIAPTRRGIDHYTQRVTSASLAGEVLGAPSAWSADAKLELAADSAWRLSGPWLAQLLPVLLGEVTGVEAFREVLYAGTCNRVYALSAAGAARAQAPAALASLDVVYRVMESAHGGELWDDAVLECAISLAMADAGAAPPILAIALWQCVDEEGEADGRWRTLMVMKRCELSLHRFAKHVSENKHRAVQLNSPAKRGLGEVLGLRATQLAAHVAALGVAHFDFKGANVLAQPDVNNLPATQLFAIDFDPLFCVVPSDGVFGVKARMFVNLLLLATHAAVFLHEAQQQQMVAGFLSAVRWPLMELWLEACEAAERVAAEPSLAKKPEVEIGTAFGAGAAALEHCELLPCLVKHRLKSNTLRHLEDRVRCLRMLQTMVLEYFFHVDGREHGSERQYTAPDPVVASWRGADGRGWRYGAAPGWPSERRAPLVRQLLWFVLFRNETEEELPERWRAALRYTHL